MVRSSVAVRTIRRRSAGMQAIRDARKSTQPIRSRTGGSTFANPPGRALDLIDRAGCRGLAIGGAKVSEQHCNFLINTGTATAADLEALGEEVPPCRCQTGVLSWEIHRVGVPAEGDLRGLRNEQARGRADGRLVLGTTGLAGQRRCRRQGAGRGRLRRAAIDVGRDPVDLLTRLTPRPDVIFNALHGRWGEDGSIQGLLDILAIPYTHSGLLASALAMHKPKAKLIFEHAGIPWLSM